MREQSVTAVFFLIFLCGCLLGVPSSSCAETWTGRVVDRQGGQAIEGAIVVRAREFIRPDQHGNSMQTVSKFALTDSEGRFQVDDPVIVGPAAGSKWVPSKQEEQCLVYRPGYQTVQENIDASSIAIEKLPTTIPERRAALKLFLDVVGVNFTSGIDHPEVRDIAQKEYEFSAGPDETLLPRKLPMLHIGPTLYIDNMTTTEAKLKVPSCECDKAVEVVPTASHRPGEAVPPGIAMHMTSSPQPVKRLPKGLSTEALIQRLQSDPNQSIRSQAAQELGRRRAVEAVPALLEAIGRDGPVFTSSCAVWCIGPPALPSIEDAIERNDLLTMRRIPYVLQRFPAEVKQPFLLRLAASTDDETRRQALTALADIRRPEFLPLFLEAAVDKKTSFRKLGWEATQNLSDRDIPALRSAAAHHDPKVRRLAMTLLCERFPMQAGDILVQAMSDDNDQIQLEVVRLARHVPPQYATPIMERALASGDRRLRKAALPLAERRDIPEGGKWLDREIERHDRASVSMEALKALCRRNDAESLALVDAYLQRNPSTSNYAALLPALIGGPNPDAMTIVKPALKQKIPKLREDALMVLGGIATPEALALVSDYADDPDPGVRKAAFVALMQAGGKALAEIERLMGHESVYIRWRAARLLGKLPANSGSGAEEDAQLVSVVMAMLQKSIEDSAAEVRLTAVESFALLKRLEGALVILPLLGDSDPGIRDVTYLHLKSITSEDFGDDQEAWREWITQHLGGMGRVRR